MHLEMHYLIESKISIGSDIQIFLLNINQNLGNIRKGIIPIKEINLASKFKFSFDTDKRLLARSFLFDLLQENYGTNNFEFGFNPYLKPYLKVDLSVHFNFSYSREYVLIGLSKGRRIGVDIEYLNPKLDINEIAQEIMSSEELENFYLFKDKQEQRKFFFEVFSAKESIVKAFGTGLYFDVRSINTIGLGLFDYANTKFIFQRLSLCRDRFASSVCYEEPAAL